MSEQILFANGATSTLAGAINAAATSINLSAGTGTLFPNPGAAQYFVGSFFDAATGLRTEIVHGTARGGDVVTIERAQEGTTAQSWDANDLFVMVPTAGTQAAFVQSDNNPGTLLSVQVVSTAGTSTPTYPTGTNTVDIELCGGGASGGGCASPGGSQASSASGGGSGAYARATMALTTAVGQVLIIGAKGAAPSAGANAGAVGSPSSFGTTLIACPGGAAGSAGAAVTPPAITGGSGNTAAPTVGAGVTALILSPGSSGDEGFAMTTTNVGSGYGGRSMFGPGASNSGGGTGAAAVSPGAGGSGGAQIASGAAEPGGAGQDGYAIIRSYS